jgi:hypothetical protein
MTPLRDDPARGWLSSWEQTRNDLGGWLLWVLFGVAMLILRRLTRLLIFIYITPIMAGRMSIFVVGGLAAVLAPGVRRSILRIKSARVERLLARTADRVASDDWTALAGEPEGTIVSVVGWVRARLHLNKAIGGESAVGIALPCQAKFPGVFESSHDFDLVDEEGRSIFVRVADGRIYGTPNVALDSHELRHLFGELGVPNGATPSGWHVHCLRDGDAFMVVGAKTDGIDPGASGLRGSEPRLTLASPPGRPLLMFSIPAERKTV